MTNTETAKNPERWRPSLSPDHTHDVDIAQHFLADHAADVIVAFDHNGMDPPVVIYTMTPGGALSPGDYYLWPLLHRTYERIDRELRTSNELTFRYDRRSVRRWARRLPQLSTLIRIRKATVQALCRWDLNRSRPEGLTVIDTGRSLTGLTIEEALDRLEPASRRADDADSD